MSEHPDISVIIVNYNTADLLPACIDAVLAQTNVKVEIIVIDNDSQDASKQVLQNYQNKIQAIFNPKNVGFGKANNLAAMVAKAEYLYLLNPDAVLQSADALQQMLSFMRQYPLVGIAGTKVIKKASGFLSEPQYFYPGQKYTEVNFENLPGDIAWVIGASMMVRRDAFEAVCGFDEDYFLYGEEADLCLRMRKLGFSIAYLPEVVVEHVGGASERGSEVQRLWQRKQNGLHVFIKKNYPPQQALKVVQKNMKRAKTRLLIYQILKMLGFENARNQARYGVVYQTSKDYIQGNL